MNKWTRDMDLVRAKEARQGVSYLPGQMDLPETAPSSKQALASKAAVHLKPTKPQLPCDLGLFSDEADQTDLIEMLMNPHE